MTKVSPLSKALIKAIESINKRRRSQKIYFYTSSPDAIEALASYLAHPPSTLHSSGRSAIKHHQALENQFLETAKAFNIEQKRLLAVLEKLSDKGIKLETTITIQNKNISLSDSSPKELSKVLKSLQLTKPQSNDLISGTNKRKVLRTICLATLSTYLYTGKPGLSKHALLDLQTLAEILHTFAQSDEVAAAESWLAELASLDQSSTLRQVRDTLSHHSSLFVYLSHHEKSFLKDTTILEVYRHIFEKLTKNGVLGLKAFQNHEWIAGLTLEAIRRHHKDRTHSKFMNIWLSHPKLVGSLSVHQAYQSSLDQCEFIMFESLHDLKREFGTWSKGI